MAASYSRAELARFAHLYSLNIIPLRVVLGALTWVICDYFWTLEDEVRYMWSQKRCLGKCMFLFIRYYTLFLVIFDVLQIHLFTIPGVTSNVVCVAMDPIVRILGAISLWAVEIIMQLRIHALYNGSRKVAIFNGVLFLLSIIAFLVIMVQGAMRRSALIASAIRLPLPGCPAINGGIQWSLWIPAMIFEVNLFGFALYRSARSLTPCLKSPFENRPSLTVILLGDNILYFLGVSTLLIFLNIMSIGTTVIPWFGFGPFHAAIGIMTSHMLMHLRKVTVEAELTSFAKSSGCSEGELDIDEVIRGVDAGMPKFAKSNSSSPCSDVFSIDWEAEHEVDVERVAGSSAQASGSGCRQHSSVNAP